MAIAYPTAWIEQPKSFRYGELYATESSDF